EIAQVLAHLHEVLAGNEGDMEPGRERRRHDAGPEPKELDDPIGEWTVPRQVEREARGRHFSQEARVPHLRPLPDEPPVRGPRKRAHRSRAVLFLESETEPPDDVDHLRLLRPAPIRAEIALP